MLLYIFITWLIFFGILSIGEMGYTNFIIKAANDLFIPIFGLLLFATLFSIAKG